MTPTGEPPLVSVVLPCFNAHRYLAQAIDSVRHQTAGNIEIIVVNDGSTEPETLAALDRLGPEVRVIHQENRGLSGARNRGFQEARGRYILPLDCDDWLAPTFVARCLDALSDADDRTFAFAQLQLEGEETVVLKKHYNGFEQLFLNQIPYCLFMPKALWQEAGGYDEAMRQGFEDWEYNIRIGEMGAHGIVVDEPLFHYRVSGSGMLKSISARRFAQLWSYIQTKHADSYRWPTLLRTWRRWRGRPSTYPPAVLFGLLLLFRLVPNTVFNTIFSRAMRFSHTRRSARTQAAG